MIIPPITPVLTGQTPEVVKRVLQCIFCHLQDNPNQDWRTTVWFISKGIQWIHFNAQSFINIGSRGETLMRQTFKSLWLFADNLLEPCVVQELRRFSDYLTMPARNSDADFVTVLSTPHKADNYLLMIALFKLSMDLFYIVTNNKLMSVDARRVWRVLIMAQTFDILYSNHEYFNFLGTYFASVAVRKWRENGDSWPFFMSAYPISVISNAK